MKHFGWAVLLIVLGAARAGADSIDTLREDAQRLYTAWQDVEREAADAERDVASKRLAHAAALAAYVKAKRDYDDIYQNSTAKGASSNTINAVPHFKDVMDDAERKKDAAWSDLQVAISVRDSKKQTADSAKRAWAEKATIVRTHDDHVRMKAELVNMQRKHEESETKREELERRVAAGERAHRQLRREHDALVRRVESEERTRQQEDANIRTEMRTKHAELERRIADLRTELIQYVDGRLQNFHVARQQDVENLAQQLQAIQNLQRQQGITATALAELRGQVNALFTPLPRVYPQGPLQYQAFTPGIPCPENPVAFAIQRGPSGVYTAMAGYQRMP